MIGVVILSSCDKETNNYQVTLDYVVTAENCTDLPKLEQYIRSIGFKVQNGYVKHLDKPFNEEKVEDVIVETDIDPFKDKINNTDIIALNTGVTQFAYTVYGIYLVTGQRISLASFTHTVQ